LPCLLQEIGALGVSGGICLQRIEGSDVLMEYFFRTAYQDIEDDISRPDAVYSQLGDTFRNEDESLSSFGCQEDVD